MKYFFVRKWDFEDCINEEWRAILGVFGAREFCIDNYIFAARFYAGQSQKGMITTFTLLFLAAFLPAPFAKKRLNEL